MCLVVNYSEKLVKSDYFGVIIYNWWRKVQKIGIFAIQNAILLKVHTNNPNIRDFRFKNIQWSIFAGRIFDEIFPKNREIRNYWCKIRFKT